MNDIKLSDDSVKNLKIIKIDESQIKSHISGMVRSTVEDTLNSMLDAGCCPTPLYRREQMGIASLFEYEAFAGYG